MANITDTQLASTTTPQGASLVGYRSAAPGSVARTVRDKIIEHNVITPEDFGAVGYFRGTAPPGNAGSTGGPVDSGPALQNFLNAINDGVVGQLGPLDYFTSTKLEKLTGNRGTLRGYGRDKSRIVYAGAGTNLDILTLGRNLPQPQGSNEPPRSFMTGWLLEDFTIDSRTDMTGGAALRLVLFCRWSMWNVGLSGQDTEYVQSAVNGSLTKRGNLHHGLWLDGWDVGNIFFLEAAFGTGDGVRVNGNPPDQAYVSLAAATQYGISNWGYGSALSIYGGKLSGFNTNIHIGGGAGGVTVNAVDINTAAEDNILIDNVLTQNSFNNGIGFENREMEFGCDGGVDNCGRDGYRINDTEATISYISFSGNWIASSAGCGINVINFGKAGASPSINVTGGTVFNNKQDGIRISTAVPRVVVSGALVRNNVGIGINRAVASSRVSVRDVETHDNGADFAGLPNAVAANFSPNYAAGVGTMTCSTVSAKWFGDGSRGGSAPISLILRFDVTSLPAGSGGAIQVSGLPWPGRTGEFFICTAINETTGATCRGVLVDGALYINSAAGGTPAAAGNRISLTIDYRT